MSGTKTIYRLSAVMTCELNRYHQIDYLLAKNFGRLEEICTAILLFNLLNDDVVVLFCCCLVCLHLPSVVGYVWNENYLSLISGHNLLTESSGAFAW